MSHLCLSGYYGFGNQGDEWILEALVAALRPDGHELTVLSAAPAETQVRHGVRAVPRWNAGRVLRAMAACDVFISGGGGLLQDATGPWTPGYYLALMLGARLLGKRVLVAGQGLGPLRRAWNQRLCRWGLGAAERVILRDEASLAWCQAQGLKQERLFLGADWVWTLPAGTVSGGRRDWGLCLRADALPAEAPPWLTAWLDLAQRRKVRVHWVVLGNRGDLAAAKAWQARYPALDSRLMDLTGLSLTQATEILGRLAWLLSLRYHGLIAGALAGVWVSGVGHDPKLSQLLDALGGTDVGPFKDPEAFAALWETRAQAGARQEAGVARLQARARAALSELLLAADTLPARSG